MGQTNKHQSDIVIYRLNQPRGQFSEKMTLLVQIVSVFIPLSNRNICPKYYCSVVAILSQLLLVWLQIYLHRLSNW